MRTIFQVMAAAAFSAAALLSPVDVYAQAISASDQATSCNQSFPCGIPGLGPAQADDLLGEPVVQKSAIEFSLQGVSEVDNASLRLVASSFSAYPDVFVNDAVLEIHGYAGDGTVQFGDLSVDNLLLTTAPITTLGVYTFDVTPYVATLVADGASYAGFAIRDIEPNSSINFYASNTLVVNVPEPEQVWLLMLGLITMLAIFHGGKMRRSIASNS
jgi:hypothetical protein